MPKTEERGRPKVSELPGTVLRSDEHAQRLFAEAHDSALDQYGSEDRYRVAYATLEYFYEKVGNPDTPRRAS